MGDRRMTWERRRAGQGPLIIGHRGASAIATENTLGAFRRAAADGADGVELDTFLCGTGEPIVFHDADLRRLADRPERVERLPLPALREVRLRGGEGVPTLEEALDACRDLLVNVELKTSGRGDARLGELIARVATVIDRAAAAERILVSSFSPVAIWRWRRARPRIRAALLLDPRAPRPLREGWSLSVLRAFGVNPGDRLCDARRMARWRRRGYAVAVWTVDAPARVRELAALGVDAIISNDPAAARAALAG